MLEKLIPAFNKGKYLKNLIKSLRLYFSQNITCKTACDEFILASLRFVHSYFTNKKQKTKVSTDCSA